MKIKWEDHPNPAVITMHIDDYVPDFDMEYNSGDETFRAIFADILGVEFAKRYGRYSIGVFIGMAFDKGDIKKRIESAIAEHYGETIDDVGVAESSYCPPCR